MDQLVAMARKMMSKTMRIVMRTMIWLIRTPSTRTPSMRIRSIRMSGCALIAAVAIATLCAPAHGETLTLDQAVQRALAFAPTVASASAQSDLSAAMVREARAPLYPSLSAGSEYMQAPGYSIAVTNGGLSDAMLTLDYTAYDFGRRLAQARAALYQSEADRYGVHAARAQIIFDTTVAYYDLVRAQEIDRELDDRSMRGSNATWPWSRRCAQADVRSPTTCSRCGPRATAPACCSPARITMSSARRPFWAH